MQTGIGISEYPYTNTYTRSGSSGALPIIILLVILCLSKKGILKNIIIML